MSARIAVALFCTATVAGAEIKFRDVTAETGLRKPLAGLMGHGAAWGDVDGDGRIDLFVGGFADRPDADYAPAEAPVPSKLLLQRTGGAFVERDTSPARHFARTSGAVFADLDNDGDLDLYVANNAKAKARRESGPQRGAQTRRSLLLRNDGGSLVDVSQASGACPDSLLTARNIGVLDYDRDGLLDLLVVEDRFTKDPSSRLFRNLGALKFEDTTAAAALPDDLFGLGLATGDLNGDGLTDVFVPHSNRLFLGAAGATLREAEVEALDWAPLDNEDWPCGAQFADLNRDGRPDLVLAVHSTRARNKVFLNRGNRPDGTPILEDVSSEAGIPEVVPARCPHVEVQDFDNDGWPDLFFSAAWMDGEHGAVTPCILRNLGCEPGGVPAFEAPGDFAREMVYFPAAPSADFDNDGRRDLLLVNWFAGNHTRLLRNTSEGGNWLQLRVEGTGSNRMGIGSKVRLLSGGKLVGYAEVSVGYGYASGQSPWLQFGLGATEEVDLEVTLPDGERVALAGVKANQRRVIRDAP